jgi:hypothetical protein
MKEAMWTVDKSDGMSFKDPRVRNAVPVGQTSLFDDGNLPDPELLALVEQRLVELTNLVATGVFNQASTLLWNGAQAGWPSANACALSGAVNPFAATVAQWQGNGFISFSLTSPQSAGTGIDALATCAWQNNYKVDSAPYATGWSSGPTGGVRFDSSSYLSVKAGAIFRPCNTVPSIQQDRHHSEGGC